MVDDQPLMVGEALTEVVMLELKIARRESIVRRLHMHRYEKFANTDSRL